MKKSLVYQTTEDVAYMTPDGLMEYGVKHVSFTKKVSGGDDIVHNARIVTYIDAKKNKTAKLVSLLTNDITFLEEPEKDWSKLLLEAESDPNPPPEELLLFN